jgi:hypothetical protein
MSLATVIRLEFAYPGVGVLAGDSLQYLSIATAHGVIMVFFMIMPTVFGAFGNFLLPTQLGVHDVAFPRLNSAAFWFLPGGLIMLCQLICADRRYQRMNCFNIRELQGILKRRFFTDLVNSSDHREILDSSMIGLRFKTNNTLNTNHDILNFYNFGTTTDLKHRYSALHNSYDSNALSTSSLNYYLNFNFSAINFVNLCFLYCTYYLQLMFSFVSNFSIFNLYPQFSVSSFLQLAILNFNVSNVSNLFTLVSVASPASTSTLYSSNSSTASTKDTLYTNLESSSDVRYNRFSNPVISYDYKCGHYLGI